jgi:hypothetical protein
MDIKELNKLVRMETGKSYLFSKQLTFKSKCVMFWRNLINFILNIDIYNLTGLFVFFILLFYMVWYKALVIGIFGYLIYVRIEDGLISIFNGAKKR